MEENFTAPHINHELFCSIMGHLKVRIRIATFEENCMWGSIWYHYLTAQPRQLQDELAELMGRLEEGFEALVKDYATSHPGVGLSLE